MKYSKEEYKVFVDKYCKIYEKRNVDDLKRDFVLEADIFNNKDQDAIIALQDIIVRLCKNSKTQITIEWKRNYIKLFFEWAFEDGIIDFKPFDDDRLSIKVLSNIVKKTAKNRWYSEEEMENLIEEIKKYSTWELYEMLIRLFYEGVQDTKMLLSIKNGDISGNIINNDMLKINMSRNLLYSVNHYREIEKIETARRPMYLFEHDDMLIKLSSVDGKIPEYDNKKFIIKINNYFKQSISKNAGFIVYPKDLYVSGFLNYFRKATDYDDEIFYNTFINIVNDRPSKTLMSRLSDIHFAYNGIREIGSVIRDRCSYYIREEL